VTCATCGQTFDETKVLHIPMETEQNRGLMSIRFVTGCKELPVEVKS
jgi:hypothetical protein